MNFLSASVATGHDTRRHVREDECVSRCRLCSASYRVVSAGLSDFSFIARHYYPAGHTADGDQTTPDL
jgi:hypothetical protein